MCECVCEKEAALSHHSVPIFSPKFSTAKKKEKRSAHPGLNHTDFPASRQFFTGPVLVRPVRLYRLIRKICRKTERNIPLLRGKKFRLITPAVVPPWLNGTDLQTSTPAVPESIFSLAIFLLFSFLFSLLSLFYPFHSFFLSVFKVYFFIIQHVFPPKFTSLAFSFSLSFYCLCYPYVFLFYWFYDFSSILFTS